MSGFRTDSEEVPTKTNTLSVVAPDDDDDDDEFASNNGEDDELASRNNNRHSQLYYHPSGMTLSKVLKHKYQLQKLLEDRQQHQQEQQGKDTLDGASPQTTGAQQQKVVDDSNLSIDNSLNKNAKGFKNPLSFLINKKNRRNDDDDIWTSNELEKLVELTSTMTWNFYQQQILQGEEYYYENAINRTAIATTGSAASNYNVSNSLNLFKGYEGIASIDLSNQTSNKPSAAAASNTTPTSMTMVDNDLYMNSLTSYSSHDIINNNPSGVIRSIIQSNHRSRIPMDFRWMSSSTTIRYFTNDHIDAALQNSTGGDDSMLGVLSPSILPSSYHPNHDDQKQYQKLMSIDKMDTKVTMETLEQIESEKLQPKPKEDKKLKKKKKIKADFKEQENSTNAVVSKDDKQQEQDEHQPRQLPEQEQQQLAEQQQIQQQKEEIALNISSESTTTATPLRKKSRRLLQKEKSDDDHDNNDNEGMAIDKKDSRQEKISASEENSKVEKSLSSLHTNSTPTRKKLKASPGKTSSSSMNDEKVDEEDNLPSRIKRKRQDDIKGSRDEQIEEEEEEDEIIRRKRNKQRRMMAELEIDDGRQSSRYSYYDDDEKNRRHKDENEKTDKDSKTRKKILKEMDQEDNKEKKKSSRVREKMQKEYSDDHVDGNKDEEDEERIHREERKRNKKRKDRDRDRRDANVVEKNNRQTLMVDYKGNENTNDIDHDDSRLTKKKKRERLHSDEDESDVYYRDLKLKCQSKSSSNLHNRSTNNDSSSKIVDSIPRKNRHQTTAVSTGTTKATSAKPMTAGKPERRDVVDEDEVISSYNRGGKNKKKKHSYDSGNTSGNDEKGSPGRVRKKSTKR